MHARAGAAGVGGWPAAWDVTMTEPREATAESISADDLASADDATLVTAFLAGRREAFDLIVERHRRLVYQVCYRFVGNHEDASDLAQDVFVRAFKGLRRFKGQSSLGTWLYRVAVNTSLNRTAVRRPESQPLETTEVVDRSANDPLRQLVTGERVASVRRAIQQLPPKQRATLILRVYQELSHEEIAAILGGTVGAAKANLFHALGSLKRLVKP
jgi:RNA polymerase sigma-70 factor (ECF subfamily)